MSGVRFSHCPPIQRNEFMRKVKIFEIVDRYIDHYDDSNIHLGQGISDWEEVSDEDFGFIRNNLWRLNSRKYSKTSDLVLVQQGPSIPEAMIGIKAAIEKEEAEEKARLEKQRKEREEAVAKRAAKKLANDKKALAKLIEENPDLVKEIMK